MLKSTLFILTLILGFQVQAGLFPDHTSFADEYTHSIEKELGLDMRRIRYLSQFIYIAHPSLLRKWKIINSDAEATYNSWLKTIEIFPNLTAMDSNQHFRLITLEEMQARGILRYNAAVIFHELSHAELDVIISDSSLQQDRVLTSVFDDQILPWFKKEYPDFKSEVALSELFAYYQEEALNFLFDEEQNVFLENGIDLQKQKCFFSKKITELAKESTREQFSQLFSFNNLKAYGEQIAVSTIFVDARDIDLKSTQHKFLGLWWKVLWQHFQSIYRSPQNRDQLVQYLNKQGRYKNMIAKCRSDYWNQLHQTTVSP